MYVMHVNFFGLHILNTHILLIDHKLNILKQWVKLSLTEINRNT